MIQTLTASELRYRRLFEAAHDGILILDPETRKIIDVNPFLISFLGYSREEFIGKELFEIGLLKDEAASQLAFRRLRADGSIRYEDLPLETKTGVPVEVEFVSNLYQEGDQQVIQCNVRDISTRKNHERAVRDAGLKLSQQASELESLVQIRTAELQASNAQLETFVYSIAHDLRAPLRSMQGFSQLLVEEHSAALNQQGKDYAKFINRAAQTMDRLLADLLAFSRISQLKIQLVPVALGPAVAGALEDCATEIQESEARIEKSPPWPVVMAYPPMLRQVLVNLISNAVKFVGAKPARVRLHAETRSDGKVRIWVDDNGIGIAAEFHQRIFEAFQRLHTTSYAGTGIGLAIVQKGVERMGGRVGVESTPGSGSRFWFELARAAIPATHSALES
jgi:PAS domain S-box-containing protein